MAKDLRARFGGVGAHMEENMKLLKENMERFVKLVRASRADGTGGSVTCGWRETDAFFAVIAADTSSQTETANKKRTQNRYIMITERGASLRYHDVIRRKHDGKIFRITSDTIEKTPKSAALALEKVTAEEWSLA